MNGKKNLDYDKNYFTKNSLIDTLKNGGYVANANSINYWEADFIIKETGKSAGEVLDIGCGTGGLLSSLPKEFDKSGIDLSDFAIEQAKKCGVKAKIADGSKCIPFNKKFDLITAIDSFEHISDLDTLFINIHNSMGEDGFLFVKVPVNSFAQKVISITGFSILHNDKTHIHKNDFNWWRSKLSESFIVINHGKHFYKNYSIPGFYLTAYFVCKKRKPTGAKRIKK